VEVKLYLPRDTKWQMNEKVIRIVLKADDFTDIEAFFQKGNF
jgi:hypothetical protein